MDKLTIKTNNVPRDVLYWHELTEKERAEFDYIDTGEKHGYVTFFRYKGRVYDLGEFMRCPDVSECNPQMRDAGFPEWHGYAGDSFFSGVVVRYVQGRERVIVGRYFC